MGEGFAKTQTVARFEVIQSLVILYLLVTRSARIIKERKAIELRTSGLPVIAALSTITSALFRLLII